MGQTALSLLLPANSQSSCTATHGFGFRIGVPVSTLALTVMPIGSLSLGPGMLAFLRRSMRWRAKYLSAMPPDVVSGLPNMTPIYSRGGFKVAEGAQIMLEGLCFQDSWDLHASMTAGMQATAPCHRQQAGLVL